MIDQDIEFRVKMVDCVGYLVDGALGAEENGENLRAFLQEHGEFSLIRERTLYPDTDGTDGFYFAVLEKRAH